MAKKKKAKSTKARPEVCWAIWIEGEGFQERLFWSRREASHEAEYAAHWGEGNRVVKVKVTEVRS